ncbi:MAG TPA: hypothetical protein VKA37_05035 [Halobacteriales archaeon]|nr:hypothetical protein [Halobacteriales archaeon]
MKLWSNRQIDAQMEAADLGVGDVIGIKKTEDTGEETEYYFFEVRSG